MVYADLTMKRREDVVFSVIATILFCVVALFLANYFFFSWFETNVMHIFLAVCFLVSSIFMGAIGLYRGSITKRVRKSFRTTFHTVPWSFIGGLMTMISVLFYQVSPTVEAEGVSFFSPMILFLIITPILLIPSIHYVYSFDDVNWADLLILVPVFMLFLIIIGMVW